MLCSKGMGSRLVLLEHLLPRGEWGGVKMEEQGRVKSYKEIMTLFSLCWGVIEEF